MIGLAELPIELCTIQSQVDLRRRPICDRISRPRLALFFPGRLRLSQDNHALKIIKSIWGGATRLGDINPEEEPYKSELAHQSILVFDITHLGGDPHSRAFDDVRSVMGMIERRLAAGQQLEEDPKRVAVVAQ